MHCLKVNKAPRPDVIPNIIVKLFAFEFAHVIADIYNVSLCNDYLPHFLKSAAVSPLPKQSPPNSIENGAVSLICQVANVMEGFTLARILPSIPHQLDNKQFAAVAVAGKSTEQAIVYILHL